MRTRTYPWAEGFDVPKVEEVYPSLKPRLRLVKKNFPEKRADEQRNRAARLAAVDSGRLERKACCEGGFYVPLGLPFFCLMPCERCS